MNSLDTMQLKSAIEESGITITALARKVGISRESLHNKINKNTEFTVSEIYSLSKVLNLSSDSRDAIFFSQECE